MGERKLASVRTIAEIKPIENADAIECAKVDGWEVVVKKGEFEVGQKCIYFEIDSFLPNKPQFEFLAKSSGKMMDGVYGYRLKTIKLRGQLSQGLILPLSEFRINSKVEAGTDLTEHIGVVLYEPTREAFTMQNKPKGLRGLFFMIRNKVIKKFPKTKGLFEFLDIKLFKAKYLKKFPSYIQKTDQERIQNLSGRLDELKKNTYEVTVKLDGSSLTIFRKDKIFGVCSRNLDVTEEENNYTEIDKMYSISETLKNYPLNIAIQGEMIGEGIQKNPEKIKGIDFYVFDIYDIDNRRYFTRNERLQVLEDLTVLGCHLKHVPILRTNFELGDMTVEDILKMAEGGSLFSKNREGLVFKSENLVNGRTVSFKAISNKYLLKQED